MDKKILPTNQTGDKVLSGYNSLLVSITDKFNNSRIVRKLKEKYPRSSQFALDRLSLQRFTGLPLTLLLGVFTANLLIFNEIAESIVNSKLLLSIDNSFAKFLFNARIRWLAEFFFYFTKLGSTPVVLFVALVAVSIFIFQKRYLYLIALLISIIGAGMSSYLGKIHFHRIRPNDYSFYHEYTYSFPSGHALFAVAFYGLIAYFFIRSATRHRLLIAVLSLLFILLLGFSRLYLCEHFLSDVVAGYSLGLAWLLFSISIVEWKGMKGGR